MLSTQKAQAYKDILKEELIPAMGCTEPIAVAYAGALAKKLIGELPDYIKLCVSGNIIKNVKSVIVPHTNGKKGLRTAVAAGVCFGDADRVLEVISDVHPRQLEELDDFVERTPIEIEETEGDTPFDIQLTVRSPSHSAFVRIKDSHTNVVNMQRDGEILLDKDSKACISKSATENPNRALLNVRDIVDFARSAELDDLIPILQTQIDLNMAISKEGMQNRYGADIGKIILRSYGNSVQNRAKAYAAAGSDARMNGCELPVVINSGSGNQGLTASVPVIVYAEECNASDDMLYRALIISNLITIHLKTGIGSLSAYCGATSAGAGAGAGICYLYGGGYDEISHTVVNALAINSGMLCDGAKASCAAKIASAVESGLLGMSMYMHDRQFYCGEGLVAGNVEDTIRAVSKIARNGMRETDNEIIQFMIENRSI